MKMKEFELFKTVLLCDKWANKSLILLFAHNVNILRMPLFLPSSLSLPCMETLLFHSVPTPPYCSPFFFQR